jgi:hypothetical protein
LCWHHRGIGITGPRKNEFDPEIVFDGKELTMKAITMKATAWITCLCLASIAHAASDQPVAPTDGQAVVVTVDRDDDGNVTKKVKVMRVDSASAAEGSGGGAGGHAFGFAVAADDDESPKVHVITRGVAAGDPNRGWLGVALGESILKDGESEPVEEGVVVLNVVKGSPAEAAGLQNNDVITAINGDPITDGVAGLSKAIGELGPGSEARLTVLREGQTQELVATLAAPKAGGIQWLHTPDMTLREKIRMHPRFGIVTPGGDMQMLELEGLDELPDAITKMIRRGTNVQVTVEDGERNVEISSDEDGAVTEVRQEGDGPIAVKRYTEGADDAVETEYADADALKAGDPEAFELYDSHAQRSASVWTDKDGDVFMFNNHDWIDSDAHREMMERLHANMSDERLQAMHETLKKAFGDHTMLFQPHDGSPFLSLGKATRTFKVTPDGQIEMTIRKSDSEIVKVFTDEDDLAARDPAAFERYMDVMNAEAQE